MLYMVNDVGTEVATKFVVKEVPQVNYMMRFGDFGADPVSLDIGNDKTDSVGEWIRDERSGVRTPPKQGRWINPYFSEKLPEGSIIDFGEGNKFLVVPAATKALQEQFPNSVFANRITLKDYLDEDGKLHKGYVTLQKEYFDEGKSDMVYSMDLDNIPLTDVTAKQFKDLQNK